MSFIVRLAAERYVARISRCEPGQTLVEYGLLLSLIVVVAVVALIFLGPMASDLYSDTGQNLQ